MFDLDDSKVETFLERWLAYGNHQFGQFRNKFYNSLEGYKQFIRECWLYRKPAFHSVQPVLRIEKLFYEFDTKKELSKYSYDAKELDDVWFQALIIAGKIKNMNAEPIITYSGKRGYHVWAYIGELEFTAEKERGAREFYKKILFDILGDFSLYPNFDKLPTHINALARLPFSYHQKTGNQVIPLTIDREPYIPDINSFKENPIPIKYTTKILQEIMMNKKIKRSSKKMEIGNWEIRKCIISALKKDPSHNARLAFLMDAIYSEMTDEKIHWFMSQFSDYDESKTQYQINYSRNSIKDRNLKPISCDTLIKWGFCDNSCNYKKRKNMPWQN